MWKDVTASFAKASCIDDMTLKTIVCNAMVVVNLTGALVFVIFSMRFRRPRTGSIQTADKFDHEMEDCFLA